MQNFWPSEYSDLNFDLPENLIATHPVSPADHARLMVIDRARGTITHDQFFNIDKYLNSGDAIFYNATRVEERRVYLKKLDGDKHFECVFLRGSHPSEENHLPPPSPYNWGATRFGSPSSEVWQVLMRNIRRLKNGVVLEAIKDQRYRFTLHRDHDQIFVECSHKMQAVDFARIGEMPIPPYMRRAATTDEADLYQNFFKDQIGETDKVKGSAASPTAALHFTHELQSRLQKGDVSFFPVCLDIGYGTFAPLSEENFKTQKLHQEHYYIPMATAKQFEAAGARKIALGTTALRALLSLQHYEALEGETEIFVKAGDAISGVEGLITNFHLPQSSLMLLTAAFCGRKLLIDAYREAIQKGYRFYSYGDAMLIL